MAFELLKLKVECFQDKFQVWGTQRNQWSATCMCKTFYSCSIKHCSCRIGFQYLALQMQTLLEILIG